MAFNFSYLKKVAFTSRCWSFVGGKKEEKLTCAELGEMYLSCERFRSRNSQETVSQQGESSFLVAKAKLNFNVGDDYVTIRWHTN